MHIFDGPHITWINDQEIKSTSYHIRDNQPEVDEIDISISDQQVTFEIESPLNHYTIFKKHKIPADQIFGVRKVLSIGDVHGAFDLLRLFLINTGVMDQNLDWTFGDGHLVFCGDIFDRGNQVTECLWLIYQLERKAIQKGGMVHLLLGNHEIMSMEGDHRYLSAKYQNLCQRFDKKYADFFSSRTELGRWLRSKNVVLKIDNQIYVHAGISPKVYSFGLSIEDINQKVRNFFDGDPSFIPFLNDPSSPIWYRGYLMNWQMTGRISEKELDQMLEFYEVNQIVFAHTEVPEITPLFAGKLMGIDISFHPENDSQGYLVENNKEYSVSFAGEKKLIR